MLNQQDIFLQSGADSQFLLEQTKFTVLSNLFNFGDRSVTLLLTKSYIFIGDIHSSQHFYYCPLTFDIKFDVLRQPWQDQKTPGVPIGICIEKENSLFKIEFSSNSPAILNLWAHQLEKKINQRNFHQLFKAKRKIGKGAFATVYLAERLVDGKMVAVKAFSKEKQYAGQNGKESLQNQIKIMRSLDHQNIMKCEGIYQTQNSIYVILEYLQGVQLNEQLKKNKKFSQEQIKQIIKNLLQGLNHLSEKRIIHRDLKPENIMFRQKQGFQLVICDFGLATNADQEKYLFVRCGTPGFVAPQIINIKDMNTKSQPISDVFSVGIIMHYLIFGQSIFNGKIYEEILHENRACDFDFKKQQYREINQHAFGLLSSMLQKRPDSRITAKDALNHCYLKSQVSESQMQIQYQVEDIKPMFQQKINLISNFESQKSNCKQVISTPSTMKSYNSGKKSYMKKQNKQFSTKQNKIPLLKKLSSRSRTRAVSRMVDQKEQKQ